MVTNFLTKRQRQFAFAAQRFRSFAFLMLKKAARNIGGDAGIQAVISGSNKIEKPAHGNNVSLLGCVHHSIMENKDGYACRD